MIDLDALQWHPRTDVFPDAKDTWTGFPNGYDCHLIYRESTKDTWGWQVSVVRNNRLIGAPMQHHDPKVIGEILRQVEAGQLCRHLDKNKHADMMLEAEKSLGREEKDILKDFNNDLPVLKKMIENRDWPMAVKWRAMNTMDDNDDNHYHDHGAGVVTNRSLRDFIRSPKLYHDRYVAKTLPARQSEAMLLESATHAAVLQREVFLERYYGDLYYLRSPRSQRLASENPHKWRHRNPHKFLGRSHCKIRSPPSQVFKRLSLKGSQVAPL
jgi:hypothetical protein